MLRHVDLIHDVSMVFLIRFDLTGVGRGFLQ